MQFPSRRARIALLTGIATLGIAGTASASSAVYSTADNVLTITVDDATGTGADPDTLTCENVGGTNFVRFNGATVTRAPDDGKLDTGCAASTGLVVTEAAGTPLANTLDLRGVKRAEWTGLAGANAVPTITLGDGADTVFGTEFGDSITPGKADDTVNGHDGNDTMIWKPGEATDRMSGDGGFDTVLDEGGSGDETFEIKPGAVDPTRVDVTRTIPVAGLFNLDVSAEKVIVNGNDGNDTINGFVGVADLIKAEINGGNGNDVLTGTDANDKLTGGEGNDNIRGLKGNDTMVGDGGDDVLQWDPGEGSDIFDGGAGNDVGVDNGGAAAEHFIVTAQGARVTATRDNLAPFFLDMVAIETLDLNTLGGDDSVEVNGGLGALIKVDADLGDGNDTIKARNAAVDVIDGAAGADSATVDANDQVANVETLDAGAAAKGAKVGFVSKKLKVKQRKAIMKITCPAGGSGCNGTAAILIKKKVVGSIAIKMAAGQTKTYKIALNKKTRAKLAKDADKKLAATARVRYKDATGATVTSKKQLKLVG